MTKIWLFILMAAGLMIFPDIGTATVNFSRSLRISDPAMILLVGCLLMALGGRGLKRKKQ